MTLPPYSILPTLEGGSWVLRDAKYNAPADVPLEALDVIDLNGYNRWQPFRLPYCTKQGCFATAVPFAFSQLPADSPWANRVMPLEDEKGNFDLSLITRRVGDRSHHLQSTVIDLSAGPLMGEDRVCFT